MCEPFVIGVGESVRASKLQLSNDSLAVSQSTVVQSGGVEMGGLFTCLDLHERVRTDMRFHARRVEAGL